MTTRLSINLSAGLIEAEGDPEFVRAVYDDLRETILTRSGSAATPHSKNPTGGLSEQVDDGLFDPTKPRGSRRRPKASGPSCAARVINLKDEGYFSDLRSAADVGAKLREKGTAYEGKHVAASLIDLVRRGALRRVQQGGSWSYQNP